VNLKNRLKKLESIQPPTKQVIVVRYPAELIELSCGGETFHRELNESEEEFIDRVEREVIQREDVPSVSILVGNF
jgi:hypothetical protein